MCNQLDTPKAAPSPQDKQYQHNNGTLESGRVFQNTNKVSHRPCFGQWANKRMRNHFLLNFLKK